ncbi:ferredoxin reductase domain-containing protein [Stutzerimonas azotifigens]|uniref:hypothetical protein n=1 Tax=Stutzerimonas azotifigens TaxID=291995 RepID=UPI0012683C50
MASHFDDGAGGEPLDAPTVLAAPEDGTHLYVCGPSGFMAHVLSTARAQGWHEANLHREYFSAAPTAQVDDGSFEVQLSSSGQVLQVPADQTVAQVLDAAGVIVPSALEACRPPWARNRFLA